LNIRVAHWANHVRPQRWANNGTDPAKKKERTRVSGHDNDVLTLQLQGVVAEAFNQSSDGVNADVSADGQSRISVDAVYDTT